MKFISSLSRIDFHRETSLQVSLTLIKNLDETFIYLWIIIRVFIKFISTTRLKQFRVGLHFVRGGGVHFVRGRGYILYGREVYREAPTPYPFV